MKYWLDGVNLNDPQGRWFPDRDTGIRVAPARRKAGLEYPRVDGVQFVPGQPFDPGYVIISLDVHGPTHEEFMMNYEFLVGLFSQRGTTPMVLTHRYDEQDETKDRIALVDIKSISPMKLYSRNNGQLTVVLECLKAFWRSSVLHTSTSVPITINKTTRDLPVFDGGTGTISDGLIRLRGGFSTATITDVMSLTTLDVKSAVAANQYLTISPHDWQARLHTDGDGTDPWSDSEGVVWNSRVVPRHGYGSMFQLNPGIDAEAMQMRYRVIVSGTNIVGTPTIQFRAFNSYQ